MGRVGVGVGGRGWGLGGWGGVGVVWDGVEHSAHLLSLNLKVLSPDQSLLGGGRVLYGCMPQAKESLTFIQITAY